MNKRVLLVGNSEIVIYKFRKELVKKLLDEGYHVTVAFPNMITNKSDYFTNLGCDYYDINIDRRGINPFKDLKLILDFKKMLRVTKPDSVITYTIKPNIYIGLLLVDRNINFYPNITGFGSAVYSGGLMEKLLFNLYRIAFRNSNKIFVQNESAKITLFEKKVVDSMEKIVQLPGSGVNLEDFEYSPYPPQENKLRLSYIGRIMADKGIYEYIEAAKCIQKKYQNELRVEFYAVGFIEDHEAQKIQNKNCGSVIFHEYIDDVYSFVSNTHAVILPSYHEGMSNVLLESGAIGRPLLASNIPGCKEIVTDGVNGFLFEPQSEDDLVKSIERFIQLDYESKKNMGIKSRQIIESRFNRDTVVDIVLRTLKEEEIE